MPAIDLTNHFCLQNTDELKRINQPLLMLDIPIFCYTSIDLKTGQRFVLTDHPEWTQYSYNSDMHDSEIVETLESPNCIEEFLWSIFSHEFWFKKSKEFGLNNGITFSSSTKDKLHYYYFGTTNDHDDQYFINIKETLRNFLPYFHYNARDLINESAKHTFSIGEKTPAELSNLDPKVLKLFLESIKVSQVVINEEGDYLTHQEVMCVYYLLQGNKLKTIAEKLATSVRTIEKHIFNIRKKINIHRDENLLGYFFGNLYLKQVIFYGKKNEISNQFN